MTSVETKVVQHDEQIKTLFNRVNKLESVTADINKLAVSVERLAINQSAMLEQQNALKEDVETIKMQPAKDAHEMKQKVVTNIVTTAVGLIVGALITLVATVLVKGGI